MRPALARRISRLCFAILIAIATLAWRASPAEAQGRITISPYAGAHFSDEDRFLLSESGAFESEVDDGPVVGLRIGIPIHELWRAELTYGWTSFEVENLVGTIEDPDGVLARETYDVHFVEAGIRWTALPDRQVHPFATLAAGIARVSFSAELLGMDLGIDHSDSEAAIAAGGGIVWQAVERVGIRLDARDHVRFCSDICGEDATLHEIELSAGATIGL
jgi:opacity protein-like surface antigen